MTESDGLKEISGSELVKRDALGRARSSREQREALLEEFARSGLSGPEFARAAGIKYQTLATWRQQQNKHVGRRCGAVTVNPRVDFVEAEVSSARDAPVEAVVRVHLPQGVWLEISHPRQVPLVVAVVEALGKPC